MRVEVLEEILRSGSDSDVSLFTLHADVSEDKLHLFLVVLGQVLPQLDNDWFEVTVNIVTLSNNRWSCYCFFCFIFVANCAQR